MKDRAPRVVVWLAAVIAQATYRAREVLLNHPSPMTRLLAENAAAREENARLREEVKLLRGRVERIPAHRRPRYPAWARLDILWFRLRHGFSLLEAARLFVVSPQTITRWEKDAQRPSPALVKSRTPLNRLADIVRDLAHRLKLEEAAWGTRRVAQTLVRLGVRVSRSSVQRILRRPPRRRPRPAAARLPQPDHARGPLRAKRPGHIWIVDLFTWDAPLRLRRVYAVAIIDLFSRFPIALVAFDHHPTARDVRRVIRRAIRLHGAPRHMASDRGPPFRAKLLCRYIARKGIRRRYGAVAQRDCIVPSIVTIDRWNRGLVAEYLRPWMLLLPIRSLQARLDRAVAYYARVRPHQGLSGRTPSEVYYRRGRCAAVEPTSIGGLRRHAFAGDGALPVYRLVRAA